MSSSPIPLLIVEDDPVFARFVRQLVLSLGPELLCAPHWADNASKALAELSAGRYELVLLDYNLPDGDGLQVLAKIHDLPLAQQPAVIMLTASGNEAVAVEAMKRGAQDYLGKAGLEVLPLLRALQTALAQKRLTAQVAAYHAQIEADLQMARHLQLSLLPDRYPDFPPTGLTGQSNLRFGHRFLPAAQLAGDFFSVLSLSGTQAGLFICDVMGHGVRSALVTAMLRALVDDIAPRRNDPGQFLAEMNRRLLSLLKQPEAPLFATAFYLIADLTAGEIRYASAGHPRPLHLQNLTGTVAPLPLPAHAGPALGLFADAKYITAQSPLAAGDILLLFTDGLFEVANAAGQEYFGQERLLETARRHRQLPLEKLLDELIGTVRAFSGGAEFGDDVCLLGMERVS